MVGDDRDIPVGAPRRGPSIWRVTEVSLPVIATPPELLPDDTLAQAFWDLEAGQNPALFDGAVFMLDRAPQQLPKLEANALRVPFRSHYYWRHHGRPQPLCHIFAVASLVTPQGDRLIFKAGGGTLNHGHFHLPGGFLDDLDVTPATDGTIVLDVLGACRRELAEEIGLGPGSYSETGRIVASHHAGELGLVVEMACALSVIEMAAWLGRVNKGDGCDELVAVERYDPSDVSQQDRTVPYCRAALAVLSGQQPDDLSAPE